MKMTVKDFVLLDLYHVSNRAVHEFKYADHSQITVARRLVELRQAGLVGARRRQGKNYNEWTLTNAGLEKARDLKQVFAETGQFQVGDQSPAVLKL